MITARPVADQRATSVLGRASPLTKLLIAFGWLLVMAVLGGYVLPLTVGGVTLAAGLLLGRIAPLDLLRALLPVWTVAAIVIVSNIAFGAANTDPGATEIARIGPLRITAEAVHAALAIGVRVLAIAAVGVVFALTTEPTRLVDALIQRAGVPERFGYGALAAYQAIPRFAEDLTTLREARRLRGLRGSWHPRLLIGLLVLAIRHGDRVALAMDARGFGSGPRTRYRIERWSALDGWLAAAGVVVLAVGIAVGR